MCKFNQNLFITILWCSVWLVKSYSAAPVDFMLLDDLIDDQSPQDHDLTYDQRQNGTENIRLRVDGVIIAVPSASSSQNQLGSTAGNLAFNYLEHLVSAMDADDDDSDYFPYVKNANTENGVTAPTHEKSAEPADKLKKKTAVKQEPAKDNSVKRVVIVNGPKNEVAPEVVSPVVAQAVNPLPLAEDHSKLDVVPVKKIQSRRKNKHKLRLAGLLDFLQKYRDQY